MRRLLLLVLVLMASRVYWSDTTASAGRAAPLHPGSAVVVAAEAGAAEGAAPRVVVVGVPGLRWSDVNDQDTPALARLQRDGASGVLSVKTAAPIDCPADGWLTLAAGNRVVATADHDAICPAALPGSSSLPDQVDANSDRREGAAPGLLADELARAGECVTGVGPGARLAAARSDGAESVGTLADAGALVARQIVDLSDPCRVVLVDATAVGSEARATGATAADALVGRIAQLRPDGTTLLVVGLSEAPGDSSSQLHVALAVGPPFEPGALTSSSTRRSSYVQLVDVAPTILSMLDVDAPETVIGEPWRSTGAMPSVGELHDEAVKARAHKDVTVPFFVVLLGVEVLLLGIGLWRRWWRLVEYVALTGVTAIGASYVANLVPWWRADQPLLPLLGLVLAGAVGMTALSLTVHARLARAGLACGLVAGILVLDLLTGAHLQLSSVAGYSPLVAGRFAGIGNIAFGVLAASVLLAAASTRSATVAALTALVVIVDGAPQWGSDVGGVLALVPAYAVLVLLLAGRAASFGRIALAAVAGAAVVTAFGIADHARPSDEQTHLGRFVGQVLDGSAGGVIQRKAEANLSLLFHSPVTALLPLVVAAALWLFVRPPAPLRGVFERSPAWRAGLLAVLTASGIGFVLNDSGAAVISLAIVVAVPATVAVLARHAREAASAG